MTDKVAELTIRVAEQKRVIRGLMEQLEFYRGFMPQHPEVHTPPPGYWIDFKVVPEQYMMGQLVDGSLIVISAHSTYEEAVTSANAHFRDMEQKRKK